MAIERICYNSCRESALPQMPISGPCRSGSRTAKPNFSTCQYFHVVFTVPEEIAAIAYQNKEVVYGILFRATAETLRTIAADPKHLGAEIGFFAVLHSWGQNLLHHPHLHCVVPGGGLSPDGTRWVSCRPDSSCPSACCPVCSGACFWNISRRPSTPANCSSSPPWNRFGIAARLPGYLAPCEKPKWVVYAKRALRRPPAGARLRRPLHPPRRDLQSLACWISKTVRSASSGRTTETDSQQKTMTLSAEEFIRRFLLHVLPDGFQRIRYYGFLGNRYRQQKLARCRQLLGMAPAGEASGRRSRGLPRPLRRTHRVLRCGSVRSATAAAWCTVELLPRPPRSCTSFMDTS